MTKEEIELEQELIKLNLLKEDLKQKTNPASGKKEIINSITVTLLVALIGFLGTTIVSLINSIGEKNLKQREFEYELIKKSLEQPTQDQRVHLLKFINEIKLIKDKEVSSSIEKILENPESIPSISPQNLSFPNEPIKVDDEFKNNTGNFASSALAAAKKYIGVSEIDIQTIAKFNRGGNNPYWSCSFICWCFSQNSKGEPPFKFTYSWADLKAQFVSKKTFKNDLKSIKVGDIYFIERANGMVSHGGIVEKIDKDQIIGIEGNVNNQVVRRVVKFKNINGFSTISG